MRWTVAVAGLLWGMLGFLGGYYIHDSYSDDAAALLFAPPRQLASFVFG